MAKRGRRKGNIGEATAKDCKVCEGFKVHWGVDCPACEGTGIDKVRKQLQKVYNAKNNLPIREDVFF